MTVSPPPIALAIAGSEASGGAGAQTDLKTFHTLGVFGATALTCIVSFDPHHSWAHRFTPVAPVVIHDQIEAAVAVHGRIDAVKVGMLGTPDTIATVAQALRTYRFPHVVVDPVLICKGQEPGAALEVDNALREQILPLATVTTPNLFETQVLAGVEEIRDVAALKAALERAGRPVEEGFLASISPAAAARIGNYHYEDDEAAVWAWAEALREEYLAITGAGLAVQIDAPDLAESWDQFEVAPDLEDYRRFSAVRIEALNHALRGIDPARVRYHVCWGSWHGPHSTDLGFDKIVDLALSVNADGLSFEAANVRHEHEWRIWRDVALPEGKYLIPGVVSHATNVLEHPELVADRIERFASLVGPERVVASTDCGLGGRVHSHIAWSKLESLVQGARLASQRF